MKRNERYIKACEFFHSFNPILTDLGPRKTALDDMDDDTQKVVCVDEMEAERMVVGTDF
jgi:hypothetical protein